MSTLQKYAHRDALAKAAAESAIEILGKTIEESGSAIWVLAGGSTPLAAYQIIAASHANDIDWSKVTFILGDERIGPLDGEFNNWKSIDAILANIPARKFRPDTDQTAEEAAFEYERVFALLPKLGNGLPRLDLVWLGIGSDGHTLSLFPGHMSMGPSSALVIPVHESPKPPSDRISLSLRALQGARNATILASGSDKRDAIHGAQVGNNSPIAIAVSIIETHDGAVTWMLDSDAATD